jgi:hypothetical protein
VYEVREHLLPLRISPPRNGLSSKSYAQRCLFHDLFGVIPLLPLSSGVRGVSESSNWGCSPLPMYLLKHIAQHQRMKFWQKKIAQAQKALYIASRKRSENLMATPQSKQSSTVYSPPRLVSASRKVMLSGLKSIPSPRHPERL